MHELLAAAGVRAEDHVLLDEVEFEPELVERDPVLDVAVCAVGLFHQDRAAFFLPQEGEHGIEGGPAGALRCLDVDELLGDRVALLLCVIMQEAKLCRDAKLNPCSCLTRADRFARRSRSGLSELQIPGTGATATPSGNAAAIGRHVEVRGAVIEVHGTSIH